VAFWAHNCCRFGYAKLEILNYSPILTKIFSFCVFFSWFLNDFCQCRAQQGRHKAHNSDSISMTLLKFCIIMCPCIHWLGWYVDIEDFHNSRWLPGEIVRIVMVEHHIGILFVMFVWTLKTAYKPKRTWTLTKIIRQLGENYGFFSQNFFKMRILLSKCANNLPLFDQENLFEKIWRFFFLQFFSWM